jgi:formylglycine-generating enzyme required for sulfatase activity
MTLLGRPRASLPLLLLLLAGFVFLHAGSSSGGDGAFISSAQREAVLCPEDMAWIPGGAFLGGASGEQVELPDYQPDIVRDPRPRGEFRTDPYCIDRYEFPGAGHRPLADVTWVQARVACETRGRRLCSEDEWAKACGGVLGWLYPYGDIYVPGLCHADVDEEGQYDRVVNSGVRDSCRSPWSTFNMEGNVSEWVEDTRAGAPWDRWVLGGTLWPGVYGRGCQARHAHPAVAPVAGDDGFRCCLEPSR